MLNFKNIHSVVIIGASEDTHKIGNILLSKNQEFSGTIYGINPKGGSAYGFDFYKSISDLPTIPDIAVFAIPEPLIYSALEEAGIHGIKKAIIITAGFKEIGKREEEIRLHTIAKKYGIRFLGPNCLGYGDTTSGLNLSFGGKFFSPGNIGIISQSGAMAVAITDVLDSRRLGFSMFYSLGNKTDIDESDILLELAADDATEVIAVYLENIARGKIWLNTLRQVTQKKPVIVMIGGVSEHGKVATSSHTGSLSGDRMIYEAVLREGGALLTYSLSEFFDLLEVFSLTIHHPPIGRPYIITNAGGPGVLATDQCDFHGLELMTVTPSIDAVLRTGMPTMMSTRNPIDIIGDADSTRVRQILENIVNATSSGDIIFFFTVQATTDIDTIAEQIVQFAHEHPSYYICVGLIGGETIRQAEDILIRGGIYVSNSTESMISIYAKRLAYMQGKSKLISVIPHISGHPSSKPRLLDQNITEKLLSRYQLQTTETYEYHDIIGVIEHTQHFHGPYIMKIAGKHIAHKTDIGGVSGALLTESDIRVAFDVIIANTQKALKIDTIEGVTIGRYISPSPSLELFFGAKRDANFGEIFVIGAGGIYLTILDDTRLHVGELTLSEIRKLIESLRLYPAISGYRKQKPADIDKLCEMLYHLSRLFFENPDIREIDINPILFDNGKPIIADAKLYLENS